MSKTVDNKQIFNKIASLIYRDKKRIIIAIETISAIIMRFLSL